MQRDALHVVDLAAPGRDVPDVDRQARVGVQVRRGDDPLAAHVAADQHLVVAQRRTLGRDPHLRQ